MQYVTNQKGEYLKLKVKTILHIDRHQMFYIRVNDIVRYLNNIYKNIYKSRDGLIRPKNGRRAK